MASIIKHRAGYRALIYVRGERSSRVFRTKREATAWAAARESELRADGATPPAAKHTVREAVEQYITEVVPGHRGARWERLRLCAMLRDPMFPADKRLVHVSPADFSVWRDARQQTVKPGTVLRELGVLSAVFETARREWRWIADNPVRDVRKPQKPMHRERVISPAEIRALLGVMGYSPIGPLRTVSQAVAVCFLAALRTGMRASELCGLTWDRVFDGYCSLPVTKTVPRDVPLTPKARRLIEKMRGFDPVFVFGVERRSLSSLFRKYRARAGLSGFTFHDARHTAATWIAGRLRDSGLPAQQALLDLCKMFGWSQLDRALTYYNPSAADIARRIR